VGNKKKQSAGSFRELLKIEIEMKVHLGDDDGGYTVIYIPQGLFFFQGGSFFIPRGGIYCLSFGGETKPIT
jgi:hypothetical protein